MLDEQSNGGAGSTEIAALAQRVATARGKLPLQHDSALVEVLSEDEIVAERELAEWIRAQRRGQRRRAVQQELKAEKRDRRSSSAIERVDEADARWHRRALAARRRVSSQDARLAQLYRRAEWSSRALIGVVILGMVWAGINVQHNLVPSGDMSDPLYWLSFGIEAMISIPIITIMVVATTAARWGRELPRGKVVFFETALLGTTIGLNAGPHLSAGHWGKAAEFSIAPVMVGVVIWLHAWVSARYAQLIDSVAVAEDSAEQPPAPHIAVPREDTDERGGGSWARDDGYAAMIPMRKLNGHVVQDFSVPGPGVEVQRNGKSSVNGHQVNGHSADRGRNGYGTNGYAAHDNDFGGLEAHGHSANGIGEVEYAFSGHETNGHSTNGFGHNRYATNGRSATRHGVNGNSANLDADFRRADGHFNNGHADDTRRHNGGRSVNDRTADGPNTNHMVAESLGTEHHPGSDRLADDRVSADTHSSDEHPGEARGGHAADNPTAGGPGTNHLIADHPGGNHLADNRLGADSHSSDEHSGEARGGHEANPTAEDEAGRDSGSDAVRAETPSRATSSAPDSSTAQPADKPEPRPSRNEPVVEQLTLDTDIGPEPRHPRITLDAIAAAREAVETVGPAPTIEPDTEDGVWAIARAIIDRRMSKLPVDQVAEILTLADQSWTPIGIGSEVGISSSAVTRILEAARKLHHPYVLAT
ncbi:hypothetical protein AB0H76_37420 [Nocardia sp. NPDC050712]|uniref:hypothetical protein n=1 Tax=Nocardia sp. NPDC050712 TaxID=3155518 RepID=UPI00340D4D1C